MKTNGKLVMVDTVTGAYMKVMITDDDKSGNGR